MTRVPVDAPTAIGHKILAAKRQLKAAAFILNPCVAIAIDHETGTSLSYRLSGRHYHQRVDQYAPFSPSQEICVRLLVLLTYFILSNQINSLNALIPARITIFTTQPTHLLSHITRRTPNTTNITATELVGCMNLTYISSSLKF